MKFESIRKNLIDIYGSQTLKKRKVLWAAWKTEGRDMEAL